MVKVMVLTHASLQELVSDPCICPHGMSHLRHIRSRHLANGRHGIDTGNPLGQESIGCLQQEQEMNC